MLRSPLARHLALAQKTPYISGDSTGESRLALPKKKARAQESCLLNSEKEKVEGKPQSIQRILEPNLQPTHKDKIHHNHLQTQGELAEAIKQLKEKDADVKTSTQNEGENQEKPHQDSGSHNKQTTFVTMSDVEDLLKQEREKNPKEPSKQVGKTCCITYTAFVTYPWIVMPIMKKQKKSIERPFKEPPSLVPYTLEEMIAILNKWVADGIIKLPEAPKKATEEDKKNPKFCYFHQYIHHSTVDCWTLQRKFHEKIQDRTLELPQAQQKVHTDPLLKHKDKAVVSVFIHENASDADMDEPAATSTAMTPTAIKTLQRNPTFRSLFNQLGLNPEAHTAATEAIMAIAAKSGAHCFTAETHASRAFLETINAITFTDENMDVQYPDHQCPLYLSATINEVQVRRALIDIGSCINLILLSTIQAAEISQKKIQLAPMEIKGFGGIGEYTKGCAGANCPQQEAFEPEEGILQPACLTVNEANGPESTDATAAESAAADPKISAKEELEIINLSSDPNLHKLVSISASLSVEERMHLASGTTYEDLPSKGRSSNYLRGEKATFSWFYQANATPTVAVQHSPHYVDDIVVKSKTREDHFGILMKVFERCRLYKLKVNPLKCALGVSVGKFIGGADIVLYKSNGEAVTKSFKFDFPCSNNTAQYEAYLAGLAIAYEMGIKHLRVIATLRSQIAFEGEEMDVTISKLMSLAVMVDLREIKDYTLISGDLYRRLPEGVLEWCISMEEAKKNAEAADLQSQCPTCQFHHNNEEICATFISTDSRTLFLEYFLEGILPPNPKDVYHLKSLTLRYFVEGGTLFRKGFHGEPLRCLSLSESQMVMKETHAGECGEHQGKKRLYQCLITLGYYWPTMKKDAADFVKTCHTCQVQANLIHTHPTSLQNMATPWSFHTWGQDLIDPINPAFSGYIWILVTVEYFTKWVEAIPLRKATGATVANFIREHIIAHFGIPYKLISDNGTPFINKDVWEVLKHYQVKHRRSTPYYPQGNGQAKATNRMLLRILSKMVFDYGNDWRTHLEDVLWAYRSSPKIATGFTPFSLVYGTNTISPTKLVVPSLRVMQGSELEVDANMCAKVRMADLEGLDEARELARARSQRNYQKMANVYSKALRVPVFVEGQMVLKAAEFVRRGLPSPSKFSPN
uniref:Integrase catalytic domain-containing protein n=1 Tax=Fagus sylvatica TaxID=28930 RepID=A0A2N9H6T6_FAGSY